MDEETDRLVIKCIFILCVIVTLSCTTCQMRNDQLIANAIKDGVLPMQAHCAIGGIPDSARALFCEKER